MYGAIGIATGVLISRREMKNAGVTGNAFQQDKRKWCMLYTCAGNGLCCTREQMVKSRKRNEGLEHLKTNLFMLAYYTIDWCKFHVHRRRDLRDQGFAKFNRMWFFTFIDISLFSYCATACLMCLV